MKRIVLALVVLMGWTLPALADGCLICSQGSSCGQYCRYSGPDNAANRKKCTEAGCKIGGTASCPSGANIKVCSAMAPTDSPLERLREMAALPAVPLSLPPRE